jgi:hypothetical protein
MFYKFADFSCGCFKCQNQKFKSRSIQKSKIKMQNDKSKFKEDFVRRGLFAFESFILIFVPKMFAIRQLVKSGYIFEDPVISEPIGQR